MPSVRDLPALVIRQCSINLFVLARSVILLAAAVSVAGCADHAETAGRHVIVILLDAARADRFSSYGYHRETTPEIDRLAAEGGVFTAHYAQATSTRPSLPRLFYSRYFIKPMFPANDRVPLANPADLFRDHDDEAISLVRTVSGAGYLSAAISAHVWLKPGTEFVDQFSELHDLSTELEYPGYRAYPSAAQVVDSAIAWIEQHWQQDFFLYLHVMDSHFPHFFESDAAALLEDEAPSLEVLARFDSRGNPSDLERMLTPAERAYLDALYDGSLRYTDRQLGRLFQFLRRRETLSETLIAIVSDHGEQLLEQPHRFSHGDAWHESVARVPFVLHYPAAFQAFRHHGLSENVDVMPTILGLLGLDLPTGKSMDGVDLLALIAGQSGPKRFAFGPRAIRDDRYKLLLAPDNGLAVEASPRTGVLYDLATDPGETRDVSAAHPEQVARLVAAFNQAMQPRRARYDAARSDRSPRTPFAIGSNHFHIGAATTNVARAGAHRVVEHEVGSGWQRRVHWKSFGLTATPGAGRLALRLDLPNGRYRVTASVRGEAEVRFGEGPPMHVAGRSTDDEAALGLVHVTDAVLRVELSPAADGAFEIRYFGFTPEAHDGAGTAIAPIPEEQLRALGYIE